MATTFLDAPTPETLPATSTAPAPEPAVAAEKWRAKIRASLKKRDTDLVVWKQNVKARLGKSKFETSTTDTVSVPADWSRSKNKAAQLFFQVPAVQARPLHPAFTGSAPMAGAALNWKLKHEVKAHRVMDEVLSDAINAAGRGVSMVGYSEVLETVKVPAQDMSMVPGITPEQIDAGIQDGTIPATDQQRKLYGCYSMDRVAPQHFLYPVEFTGSDFQQAPWLGWEGWILREEALRKFKLAADFKVENSAAMPEYLTDDQPDRKSDDEYVHFVEIFYRASLYSSDPADQHPQKIKRMVLLDNRETEPVIDEDFTWQRYDPKARRFLGMKTFPIKVLTLTYVSDMPAPPSDTEMGRPQVQEMIEHRSLMVLQRKHSQPMRWFDANQVDPDIIESMKQGDYQGMIPTQGPGTNVIGEVARANYPRDNYEFMNIIKSDLDDAWASGDNQNGHASEGDISATEANIVQTNSNLRGEYERSKVLRFFQENAEGVFALMQLFQTDEEYAEIIGADGVKQLSAWDRNSIPGDYIFEIAPDASQRLDVNDRLNRLMKMYTLARQDQMLNPQPLLREIVALQGLDVEASIQQPAPQPDKPSVGFSFKGEDLGGPNAPMVIAILQKSGINITADDIAAAKRLYVDAAGETVAPVPGAAPPGAPGAPPAAPALHPEHGGTPPVQEPITKRFENGESAV